MNRDTVDLVARFIVSICILAGMFTGEIPGGLAGAYATIIMGIDWAAAYQAYKNETTDD